VISTNTHVSIGTQTAWKEILEDGTERIHRGVVVSVATCGADGQPASMRIRIVSPHKFKDDHWTVMSVDEVAVARDFFREVYEPPPTATHLMAMIALQAKAEGEIAARRGFANDALILTGRDGKEAEVPVNPRLALAWSDVWTDGKGGKRDMGINEAHMLRMDDCFTVIVSRKTFDFLREPALLSKLFEFIGSLEKLTEEMEK
jgi:hypothetical protein